MRLSALSNLSSSFKSRVGGWPTFSEKFPLKVKLLDPAIHIDLDVDLEDAILEAGDALQGRTEAKCLMTHWTMHAKYQSFRMIGDAAITVADSCPLAKRTLPDGTPEKVPLYIKESWGLIYKKEEYTNRHTHWPSLWSYTYCVKACEDCAPLVFPTVTSEPNGMAVEPQAGQIIVWPAWLNHFVGVHGCDHDRIMVAGNLDVGRIL